MATHRVLRAFPLAADGLTTRLTAAGEEIDVRPALVAGLIAEGYIAALDAPNAEPQAAKAVRRKASRA